MGNSNGLRFKLSSVEDVTTENSKIFGNTIKNPLVSYEGNGVLLVIGRVSNANAVAENWKITTIPSGPDLGVLINYSGENNKTGEKDYRFKLNVSGIQPPQGLTVDVDGNEMTEEPKRKTKIIVSG